LNATITVAGGLFLIVLETVFLRLLGITVFVPQLAVLAVVYVGVRKPFTLAAVSTLIFAATADICSGGPRGYYALGLTVTFFATVLMSSAWKPGRALSIALTMIPAVVLTDLVTLVALALFRRGDAPLGSLLASTPIVALWTAFASIPLAWGFFRVDRALEGRRAPVMSL
jgi:rod shape-determining protein MreD